MNIQQICPHLLESQIFQSSYLFFWCNNCFQRFWSVVHLLLFRSIAHRDFYHFFFWVILCLRCVLLYELHVPKICHLTWIIQHGSSHLHYWSILSFSNSILLRCSGYWNCLFIPCSSQYLLNSSEVNSPPLSNLRHLIRDPVSFSTNSLNVLKHPNAFDFLLRRHTHVILV